MSADQLDLPADLASLAPLFEEPAPWFEGNTEQYYMAVGGMGRLVNLSLEAVTFAWVNNGASAEYHPNHVDLSDVEPSSATVVENRAAAQDVGERATWARSGTRDIYLYERVPFEDTAETPAELHRELKHIMANPPNLAELFGAVLLAEP